MYKNMRAYANNGNKYGKFDFSDYNKVITAVFDIK